MWVFSESPDVWKSFINFRISLKGSCSMCSCIFGVSVRRRKFRRLLGCRLGPESPLPLLVMQVCGRQFFFFLKMSVFCLPDGQICHYFFPPNLIACTVPPTSGQSHKERGEENSGCFSDFAYLPQYTCFCLSFRILSCFLYLPRVYVCYQHKPEGGSE